MKLYEIAGEFLQLQEMLEDEELDAQVVLDTLEGIEGELNDKIESLCKIIKNIDAQAAAFKAEENRLKAKRISLENKTDSIKQYMYGVMKSTSKTKCGGELFTAAIQKNGGKLPLIMDCDPEDLPVTLRRVEVVADNDAIRQYLDDGGLGYAHYGERGEHLTIK